MMNVAKQLDNEALKNYNDNNLSNGFLMRITPLAIYIAGMLHKNTEINKNQFDKIREIVRLDTSLTHSSEKALNYATSYVILIAFNILEGKISRAIYILQIYLKDSEAIKIITNGINYNAKLAHDPTEQIGDVKIAFQLAVRKSYFNFTFEEAIISTVMLGGDTDTNCCIVGGMVGAKLGSSNINQKWKDTVEKLQCDRYVKLGINTMMNNLGKISRELFELGMKN
jgi:ADP-ribosylglycohydrolase